MYHFLILHYEHKIPEQSDGHFVGNNYARCRFLYPHIRGNGNVVKEERKVSDFEALEVSTGVEVLVTQDSIEKVVVEVDSNLLKILKTRVESGTLKIYLEEGILHANH